MRRRRTTILVSVVAVVAGSLAVAGCGGSASSGVADVATSTTGTTTAQDGSGRGRPAGGGSSAAPRGGNHTVMSVGNAAQGTEFSACMRKHGLPALPDPNAQGMIQFGSAIDPHSPTFRSALSACRKLLPGGFGRPPTAAQLAQVQQQLLAFSKCMRAHGLSDFPDPSDGGLPRIQPRDDLDPGNPGFQAAYRACKGHLPLGLPAKALGGLGPPATGNSGGGGGGG